MTPTDRCNFHHAPEEKRLDAAYVELGEGRYLASPLTVGPWDPKHQHAGPPSALICRAVERAAAKDGLTHLGRLTVNLLRPAPVGECRVEIGADYVGHNAGHFSGRLTAAGKEIARFTALMQREEALAVPDGTPGHPAPRAPKPVDTSPIVKIAFAGEGFGYADLVENRLAAGRFFDGPCAAWFRMNHPLVKGEDPSPYQRVAIAADSGNGISASLDFKLYVFLNCDLTINLFRRPTGTWICLESASRFGGNGCGLAESALYDEAGLIGRASQSLAIRKRSP
jgi:Acyl-CoA thioesterase C-terminal domain/Acyl-CoA thioesterase N-terminal domain